jgi:hypothetical protein
VRTIIELNPAEHVLRPMRELMLSGYDWGDIGIGFLAIAALGAVALTHRAQLPERLQLNEERSMNEQTEIAPTPPPSETGVSCCAPDVQATCCEPSEKAGCCSAQPDSDRCGCQ